MSSMKMNGGCYVFLAVVAFMLFASIALVADSVGMVDLDKVFGKEASYSPPEWYAYTVTNLSPPSANDGISDIGAVFSAVLQFDFYKNSGEGWGSSGTIYCTFPDC